MQRGTPSGESSRPEIKASEPAWLKTAPLVFLFLWSGGYSAVTLALEGTGPIYLQVLRYAAVLAILIPAWVLVRPPLPETREAYLHLAMVGTLVQGLYFGSANFAIQLGASAAVLGIVLALQPVLVALIAPWLLGERTNGLAWFGLALGLAGAVVAILAKSGIGGATVAGAATAFVSLLFITVGTLYERRFGKAHHPIVSNGIQCGVALAWSIPLALALEPWRFDVTPTVVAAIAYLAIGNSIVSMTLLFAMLRAGAVARATSLLFLVPAVSASMAWVVLGEPMPPAVWAGLALAAAGVALVRRR